MRSETNTSRLISLEDEFIYIKLFVASFHTCPLSVSESETRKQATSGETISDSDKSASSQESIFGKIKRKLFG